jgi:hypothetical protein
MLSPYQIMFATFIKDLKDISVIMTFHSQEPGGKLDTDHDNAAKDGDKKKCLGRRQANRPRIIPLPDMLSCF